VFIPRAVSNATLVWFRLDLRLADNPALRAARDRGGPVVPVFIWAPEEEAPWEPGAASRWWLHQSLASLNEGLEALGSRLILRQGPALEALRALAVETGADAVFWNRRYEPALTARDAVVKSRLKEAGLGAESFNSALLHEPWTIQNKAGKPFQVFTAFWRHCLALPDPREPLAAPRRLDPPARWPSSVPLAGFGLEPRLGWAEGFREVWQPGEPGAARRLEQFLVEGLAGYAQGRNRPDQSGTSRLSPHLHFGELSPHQVWQGLQRAGLPGWRQSVYLNEIGWREFAHHLLFHFPRTPGEPLRPEFKNFPWRQEPGFLKAWQRGRTGFPIVDAGMRELWRTGWMHNRVRMITASFLVKDLLIPWQDGARWFWDTLVDADLAQNTLGWQWTAGCGADAAPYFRVFNPVSQGEKFDPAGAYVRHWIPELAGTPDRWVHQPWNGPPRAGAAAGRRYPERIISHETAREVALEAWRKLRA